MDVRDCHGNLICVGSWVRVLAIAPVGSDLAADEVDRVNSMLGEVFEVYEIDSYGRAWVEKWWRFDFDQSISHSLGLEGHEMELSEPAAR